MATNANPIQFINPINLGGNELLNAKVQIFNTLPLVADYTNQIVSVGGKPYFSDGVEWHDLSSIDIDNVHVDTDNTTIATFVAAHYTVGNEYHEGDMIILVNATDTALRTYIHNGGTTVTVSDFSALPSNISEAFVRGAISATGAIDFDVATGIITLDYGSHFEVVAGSLVLKSNSVTTTELADDAVETANIKDLNVTEGKLSTEVQAKLNKAGLNFSLADTGVSGVAYSNGVFTVTHNLNSQSVAVVMRDSTNAYRQVPVNNDAPTVNTVRIYFAEQPTNNQYKITVLPLVF